VKKKNPQIHPQVHQKQKVTRAALATKVPLRVRDQIKRRLSTKTRPQPKQTKQDSQRPQVRSVQTRLFGKPAAPPPATDVPDIDKYRAAKHAPASFMNLGIRYISSQAVEQWSDKFSLSKPQAKKFTQTVNELCELCRDLDATESEAYRRTILGALHGWGADITKSGWKKLTSEHLCTLLAACHTIGTAVKN
jgi:hypothetical protein